MRGARARAVHPTATNPASAWNLAAPALLSPLLFFVSPIFSISPPSSFPSLSETLYEDESFPSRELAAVVASKVFYHLEELDDALRYALGAGPKFDVTSGSEYVQTLLSKCIDEYIRLRVAAYENKEDAAAAAAIDPRLVAIVERMFDKCFTEVSAHGEHSLMNYSYATLGERRTGRTSDILLFVRLCVVCACAGPVPSDAWHCSRVPSS